jgi:hypothetical protein
MGRDDSMTLLMRLKKLAEGLRHDLATQAGVPIFFRSLSNGCLIS